MLHSSPSSFSSFQLPRTQLNSTRSTTTPMASSTTCLSSNDKKHWWLTTRKIVDKYIREARALIANHDHGDISAAVRLLDAALEISPRFELALELKARSLLFLGRFKDVADMLQDYIPSLKISIEDSSSSSDSSSNLSKERVKLLANNNSSSEASNYEDSSFKCFSISDLRKKVMAGLCKNGNKEGQWRYLVLGQACCHLGLMEDAMALLQTGKRLAAAAFRRESTTLSDDSFSFPNFFNNNSSSANNAPSTPPRVVTETETVTHLLGHIKQLLRRRTAALAALEVGAYAESIRHFSKILDGRRGAPQGFLAECYMQRAAAYKATGRIAEAIADCNRTLALDPSCIQALDTRAALLETVRCLPDCLHDLEHLKLLYNSILRDRKLPGPAWKRHNNVRYREIPGKLCVLTTKIQELKQRVASGETGNVDYYALIGLRRGCSRSELEKAYLLLCLRHKPDKAMAFMERCELADDRDIDSVRDRAKLSALLLYRLLQKGYSSLSSTVMDEEAAEKQRKKTSAALQAAQSQAQAQAAQAVAAAAAIQIKQTQEAMIVFESATSNTNSNSSRMIHSSDAKAFQGVFCRDIAVVGNLLSQVGFNRPMTVKYEALSC